VDQNLGANHHPPKNYIAALLGNHCEISEFFSILACYIITNTILLMIVVIVDYSIFVTERNNISYPAGARKKSFSVFSAAP
jgi:hypothetical protein